MSKYLSIKPSISRASRKLELTDQAISRILKDSEMKIFAYLHSKSISVSKISKNFKIKSRIYGHNNQIYLIDLYNDQKKPAINICLKYSIGIKKREELKKEFILLDILHKNNMPCPAIIASNFSSKNNISYILLETVEGECVSNYQIDIQKAGLILDSIRIHESILLNNIKTFNSISIISNLHKKIDFEKKLLDFISNFAHNFIVKDSLNFLNKYLNNTDIRNNRTIITDRSAENIFINRDEKITMIDFSTIRIGTQFDNWIQFIDDPRITFLCSKNDLITLFFNKNSLSKNDTSYFYAASVHTNLLQGIFTYSQNPKLGTQYISNANDAFKRLTKRKGVLIDINH